MKDTVEIIKNFAGDNFEKGLSAVFRWFLTGPKVSEVFSLHKALNDIGCEYRKFFRNKGQYKTTKRVFARYCMFYLSGMQEAWPYMPIDLIFDILVKAKQGWMPVDWTTLRMCSNRVIPSAFWEFLLDKYKVSGRHINWRKCSSPMYFYLTEYRLKWGFSEYFTPR